MPCYSQLMNWFLHGSSIEGKSFLRSRKTLNSSGRFAAQNLNTVGSQVSQSTFFIKAYKQSFYLGNTELFQVFKPTCSSVFNWSQGLGHQTFPYCCSLLLHIPISSSRQLPPISANPNIPSPAITQHALVPSSSSSSSHTQSKSPEPYEVPQPTCYESGNE